MKTWNLVLLIVAVAMGIVAAPRAATGEEKPVSGSFFELRGGIDNCRSIFQNEKRGRVVFLGGSITTMKGWRDLTCDMLRKQFSETTFDFIDAGIGGTNSTLGAFRFEQDVFKNGPVDLLFLEFAVNDGDSFGAGNRAGLAMEGIIRHARKLNQKIDIVVQYFVDQEKLAAYTKGDVPRVITEHDRIAAHYGIPALNLALEMTRKIKVGEFTWEQFTKDTCHPTPFGHEQYAGCIRAFLDAAWDKPCAGDAKPVDHSLPVAIDPLNYENGRMIPHDQARIVQGWTRIPAWTTEKTCNYGGAVDVLATETPDASLELAFEGTLVGMYAIAGMDAGVLEAQVDDAPPQKIVLFDHYCEMFHRPVLHIFAEGLPGGKHILKLRMTAEQPEKSTGHAARILKFVTN